MNIHIYIYTYIIIYNIYQQLPVIVLSNSETHVARQVAAGSAASALSFSHCSSALAAASGSDQAQKARCASARSRRLPRNGVLVSLD